jgi:hypothetical protein
MPGVREGRVWVAHPLTLEICATGIFASIFAKIPKLSYHLCKDKSTSSQRYCYFGDAVMTETYAKRETQSSRGDKKNKGLRVDANSGKDVGRTGQGAGSQRVQSDRENRSAGDLVGHTVGGILDQLIEDAEGQLVKTRECVVWYQSELKEREEKLQKLRKLKDLHQQQIQEDSEESEMSP